MKCRGIGARVSGGAVALAAAAAILLLETGEVRAQVGREIISVKTAHTVGMTSYPAAAGDGTTDDTSAIQGAIYYALASATNRNGNGAAIFFPEGTYVVTSTITVPACGSLDFLGASAQFATGTVPNSTIVGYGTWSSSTQPLFSVQASNSRWTDLHIAGRYADSGTVPSALISTASGSGCVSSIKFENVKFWANRVPWETSVAGTGLSFGSGVSDNCNSEISFYGCQFAFLQTGIKVNSSQGLDYVFEQTGAVLCKTFLDLAQGGNVSFNTGTFSACGGEGSGDWIFKLGDGGSNTGVAKITNARFEAGCQKLVRVDGAQIVLIDGLSENTPGTTSAVVEVGTGSVTFASSKFSSFPVLNFATPGASWGVGTVRFRDCMLPVVPEGTTVPSAPTPPAAPPSGLITGTGRYVYEHCVTVYSGAAYYPYANSTNVTGW